MEGEPVMSVGIRLHSLIVPSPAGGNRLDLQILASRGRGWNLPRIKVLHWGPKSRDHDPGGGWPSAVGAEVASSGWEPIEATSMPPACHDIQTRTFRYLGHLDKLHTTHLAEVISILRQAALKHG